jgi:hypothetical protein
VQVPGCGHKLVVPCYQREAYAAGRLGCSHLVELPMPLCGHTAQVRGGPPLPRPPMLFSPKAQAPAYFSGLILEFCFRSDQVACSSCDETLLNPLGCTHACSKTQPRCEHECQSQCGACLSLTIERRSDDLVQGGTRLRSSGEKAVEGGPATFALSPLAALTFNPPDPSPHQCSLLARGPGTVGGVGGGEEGGGCPADLP